MQTVVQPLLLLQLRRLQQLLLLQLVATVVTMEGVLQQQQHQARWVSIMPYLPVQSACRAGSPSSLPASIFVPTISQNVQISRFDTRML